ncbi:MAG TPA: substrate-binding domain-containing protein [Thermoplasmata archaeon]|nr:substrate-binding domain-containing protein [Thermoplasmata archaeon]
MRKRTGTVGMGVAIGIAVVLLIVGIAGGYELGTTLNKSSSTSTIQLTETGSSLLYPLMVSWGPNYTAYNSQVVLAPESTGSGTGQSYAELGLVNIGASDGYLSNASATSLINLPVAISAQLIYYNLPGISAHINLNGTILAMIYAGAITTWNNPLILAAQSPGVATQLSAISNTIVPIKRSDSSGDTFLFSSLCYMSWSGWPYKYSTSALSGSPWTGATGNSGVVAALQKTQYSIGYVGISYESTATGLTYAAVGNDATLANGTYAAAGSNYVLPSATNISQDANLALTHLQFSQYQLALSMILGGTANGAINITLGGGGTLPPTGETPYPIANLEYTLIKTSPTGTTVTSSALAATVHFLQWAISYGNFAPNGSPSAYIDKVNFIPLTPEVIGYDQQELASVTT